VKRFIMLAAAVLLLAGCAGHRYRSEFDFANKLAREGLWQEALFRLQKARAAGEDSAALHNNMAVVLEALGRPDEAQKEYELALKLAPANERIRANLDKFKRNEEKDLHEKK